MVVNEVVLQPILRYVGVFKTHTGASLFVHEVLMFCSGAKECNFRILDRKKDRRERKDL